MAKVVARLRARLAAPATDPPGEAGAATLARPDLAALIARLAARDEAEGRLRWIRASQGNALTLIHVDDVLYFQAEDKYTKVVTAGAEALIRKPIKELYDELDPDAFWQIHRGTIVNLRAIDKVTRDWRDQPVIALHGRPERLTVSRTFAHRFKAM
jgi:DNA-binding LytR/AlgR family response regulator